MAPRLRRAAGAALIIVWLVVWVAGAAVLADQIAGTAWYVQLAFYATAGVAWAFPLRPLFKWMG